MSESERSEERLTREAQVLLGAGTASTARTIGFASYYILSRPDLRAALREELSETMSGWPHHIPTWAHLERLPLLQAIIKESLR
jgi:cytochrome P450